MFYSLATNFLRKLKQHYESTEMSVPKIIDNVLENCDKGLCAGSSAQLFYNDNHLMFQDFWLRT